MKNTNITLVKSIAELAESIADPLSIKCAIAYDIDHSTIYCVMITISESKTSSPMAVITIKAINRDEQEEIPLMELTHDTINDIESFKLKATALIIEKLSASFVASCYLYIVNNIEANSPLFSYKDVAAILMSNGTCYMQSLITPSLNGYAKILLDKNVLELCYNDSKSDKFNINSKSSEILASIKVIIGEGMLFYSNHINII